MSGLQNVLRWTPVLLAVLLHQGSAAAGERNPKSVPATSRKATAARSVSWMDLTYDFGEDRPYKFSGGRYADLDEDGSCNVCMEIHAVTFGDLDGDGRDEALVLVHTNLGGAGNSLDGFVYTVQAGVPLLKAKIEGGDRGEGGIESMVVKDGDLIVRRFALSGTGSICCPDRIEIEHWRWTNGKLAKVGQSTHVRRKPRPWWLGR